MEQFRLPLLPPFGVRIPFAGQNDQRYIAKGIYRMLRTGIGQDLTRIALDPKHPRKIAREAELLALRPKLNHLE